MAASPSKPLHFLITGAGRGIGRGLSRLLVQGGHRVFLVDSNQEELRHTCDTLAGSTASALSTPTAHKPFDALHCNLRQPIDIDRAAKAASEFFTDHLDVLVNNAAFTAGVGGPSILDSQDEQFTASWIASLETNLTAPLLLSRACLPMLKKQPGHGRESGGSIVHMASTRAYQSEPDSEGYAATKAGLIGLTHSMAVSLAPVGVRVNAILPGWIHAGNECKEADEKGATWEEGLSQDDQKWHLNGRVGKVDDILAAVEYLAKAEFVTGTEMIVDGGVTRKMVYPE
jgi:NAD(P)-dependent dehydrogenase (short-subunit alcohol dehydrogenase family)